MKTPVGRRLSRRWKGGKVEKRGYSEKKKKDTAKKIVGETKVNTIYIA